MSEHQQEGDDAHGTYTISDLEQVKVLANPLRIRLLESFAEERTTKQVAELLGEKPTRLYHHVDALERVGLIRLTRTQPNRGTVEKYYLSVARTFRTDSALFSADTTDEDLETLQGVVSTMLNSSANELQTLIADHSGKGVEEEGVLSFLEIRGTEKYVSGLQEKFMNFIEEMGAECEDEPEDGGRRFRLLLAYYPLDLDEKS